MMLEEVMIHIGVQCNLGGTYKKQQGDVRVSDASSRGATKSGWTIVKK